MTHVSGKFHGSISGLQAPPRLQDVRGVGLAQALPQESRRALPPTHFRSLVVLPNFNRLGFSAPCRVFTLHRQSGSVWFVSKALVKMILLLLRTRLERIQSLWVLKPKSF